MAAESLDDGEFWLPPKFLADSDDIFMETASKTKSPSGGLKDDTKDLFGFDAPLFPLEFPYGFESSTGGGVALSGGGWFLSDLSSPVESNTESESSDGEDYLAGLTRRMAHSTVEDIDFLRRDSSFAAENPKARGVSGSPQSTLCSVGSGCGCGQGSSHGSPNGVASGGVSSPPATWDLLYAAAGEVAKMRRDDDELFGAFNNNDRVIAPPPRKPSPVTVPLKTVPDVGLYNQQQQQQQHQQYHSLSYQKLQASQFHLMRQQQMIKQQQSSVIWGQSQVAAGINSNRGRSANNTRTPLGLSSSAWPSLQAAANTPQQQQQGQGGSGMRAVFLGNGVTKKESVGTGVFLPRRIGTRTESRKPVSTVLLPARVVQALNLNLEDMRAQPQVQPRFNGAFVPDSAAASRSRKNNVSQQKQNSRQQQGMNVELQLPQEWTY